MKSPTNISVVCAQTSGLSGIAHWPDGTLRSTGYPWNWRKEPEPMPSPTLKDLRNEKQAAYQLEYDRKKRAAKAASLRVNKEQASCGSNATNSERAPR